jgi:hypothetical protein
MIRDQAIRKVDEIARRHEAAYFRAGAQREKPYSVTFLGCRQGTGLSVSGASLMPA